MGYVFYLNGVQLPVPPSKMTTKIKNNNKTINLINEGDVNILKLPGLTEISFDALIPGSRYPFASEAVRPAEFLGMLEKLKTSRRPCRFIVSRDKPRGGSVFGTNMSVALEDYQIKEDAAEIFDLTVSIKLKQYKPYGTKTIKQVKTDNRKNTVTAKKERSAESAPNNKTHTVKEGETLWNIAKKEYGNGARYNEIYEKNPQTLHNISVISAGQVLIV